MKSIATISILAASVTTAAAAPAKGSSITIQELGFGEPFKLTCQFAEGSDAALQPLNANGGAFWLGKKTASSCPSSDSDCPPGTETIFRATNGTSIALNSESVYSQNKQTGGQYFYDDGQRVYIAPDSTLSFLPRGGVAVPKGSITDGFTFPFGTLDHADPTNSELSLFLYGCEQSSSTYKVHFAKESSLPKSCKRINCAYGAVNSAYEYV